MSQKRIYEIEDSRCHVHLNKMNAQEIEDGMKLIIQGLGLSCNDEHLRDTPKRVAKMYMNDLCSGLNLENEPKVTTFSNKENFDMMVHSDNIEFFGMCSHHFAVFRGHAWIAYIPSDKIIGISKLARILDFYAKRPTLQERVTNEVVNYIMKKANPLGCGVHLEAIHDCMAVRGAKKPESLMKTTALRGVFTKPEVKAEFEGSWR